MKRLFICFIYLSVNTAIYSQVGINTLNPKALLDIEEVNKNAPSKNTGLVIPKIENFPSVNPIADQNSMLTFYEPSAHAQITNAFFFWRTDVIDWDQIFDSETINIDYSKIIVSSSNFYNSSGAPENITNAQKTAYVLFESIYNTEPRDKLTPNQRLQIGREGYYIIYFTGGVKKTQAEGVCAYSIELLLNESPFPSPIITSISLPSNPGRAMSFGISKIVKLDKGDKLGIKVIQQTDIAGSVTTVNSSFNLSLTLLKQI